MLLLLQQNLGFAWGASSYVPPTPPVVVAQTGGGQRVRREQYLVKIDGQEFLCRSLQEVEALLFKAREAAKLFSVKEAEKAAARAAESAEATLPTFDLPRIEANSRDVRPLIAQAKKDIAETYRQALIDTEMRMLFEVQVRREHDDDAMLLLM